MKKAFFIVAMFQYFISQAQENTLGIGLITDNRTKLSKSFAFYELFTKNKLTKNGEILTPKLSDFVYLTNFGIEGITYENTVDLKLYRNGKKIKTIKCINDWEIIFNEIYNELKKDNYELKSKFTKVDEGKQTKFYSRSISENLPGKLTIQIPETKLVNFNSVNSKIVRSKAKNPYQELVQLFGKYGTTDINDILVFKSPDVPTEFKANVKPLVYPISNTMAYSLKMLGYGGCLAEQKDYFGALNCFYTVLNTSNNILCSPKEKAVIKSFAFKNIADIYSIMENRQDLAKLFYLGFEVNNAYSNSASAQKDYDNYYQSVNKVAEVCKEVETNLQIARNARFSAVMGAVSSGIASSSSLLGNVDTSSFSNLATTYGQQSQMGNQATEYFNQLSQAKELINADSFKVEGITLEQEHNYVSEDILNLLFVSPNEIKSQLLEFAKDKPLLSKEVSKFYQSKAENNKDLVTSVYSQLYKIELITIALEAKDRKVEEKYKSKF